MPDKSAAALDSIQRKALKYGESRTQEKFVRVGQLVDRARERRGWTREELADKLGVSESLLSRQIANQDGQHVSLQRALAVEDDEWLRILAELQLERLHGVIVETRITLRRQIEEKEIA